MHISFLAVAASLLAAVVATTGQCPSDHTETCPAPPDCPAEKKKCTGGQPTLTPTSAPVDCGQKDHDTVTVTFEPCGNTKCIVIDWAKTGYTELHFTLSLTQIQKHSPGQFLWHSPGACSLDTSSCSVTIGEVLSKLGLPSNYNICELTLWVGAHAVRADGETCWPDTGIPIPSHQWGDQFSIKFTCPPEECCCCIPPTPPQEQKCEVGTFYAYTDGAEPKTSCLIGTGCTNAWGFWQEATSFPYTAKLIADAGQCNVGNGKEIGSVLVTRSGDCFTFDLTTTGTYGFGVAHIHIACDPPNVSLGNKCRTPGQYEFNSGCFAPDPYSGPALCQSCPSGKYHILVHGEAFQTTTQAVCPDGKPIYTCTP